jgi:hypothetical protein
MMEIVIRKAPIIAAAPNSGLRPRRRKMIKNNTPVRASTAGSRNGMGAPQ